MSKISKLNHSRDAWKGKAVGRAGENGYLRKENHRLREAWKFQKKRADEAEAKFERQNTCATQRIETKVDLVYLALQLFLLARIGFRAVARVLTVLGPYLGITKAPCAQTVINWVTRLSITRIYCATELVGAPVSGDLFSNGFIWMIDTTVGFGSGKILAVLALSAHHHLLNKTAPSLKDVHCVAVSVAPSWTGESVAAFLARVIAVLGRPVAFLKDRGSDLGKAARLLDEQGLSCRVIDDISHVIANSFKRSYGEHPLFDDFLSICGKISKNIKQTALACLAPPKTSTKARFMNLHRLVRWAEKMLDQKLPEALIKGTTLRRFRAAIKELPSCQQYIQDFLRDSTCMLECQKILKKNGLSDQTAKECKDLMERIPEASPIREEVSNWLDKSLQVAKTIGVNQDGLPISSDQIESLYSVAKQHGVGEIKDANRIALHIPALTGTLTREDAQRVLDVKVAEQAAIEGGLTSLVKQRRQVLGKPENIETLFQTDFCKNLEIIPRSKNQGKMADATDISTKCGKMVDQRLEQKIPSSLGRPQVKSTSAGSEWPSSPLKELRGGSGPSCRGDTCAARTEFCSN